MKLITAKSLATPIDRWLGRPAGSTFEWRANIKDLVKLDDIDVGTGLIIPLERVPIGKGENKNWVIAALSPRFPGQATFTCSGEWAQDKVLWMEESATFSPLYRSTLHQVKSLRKDLQYHADPEEATYCECPWWTTNDDVKSIHPMEITPPAASGILALVLRKEDNDGRTEALAWHNKETATVSNVERSILLEAINKGCEAAVHVEKDDHGRFHLYLAVGQDASWNKISVVHDGWKGLTRVGTAFIDETIKQGA